MPQFSIYNIQLAQVAKAKPDFGSELYCWRYTLYTATHNKHISTK